MANETTPEPETTPAPLQYRSVGVRFVALLIDVIIAGIIASVFASSCNRPSSKARILPMELSHFHDREFARRTWQHHNNTHRTLLFHFPLGSALTDCGLMVFKIKVVKDDGAKIGYVDALIRSLLLIIDAIPFIIPFLLLQFLYGRRKRDSELETVRHTPS